jgi:hypothetical protein
MQPLGFALKAHGFILGAKCGLNVVHYRLAFADFCVGE